MFNKNKRRLEELEEVVDDLVHDTYCNSNPMNLKKRVERLELFKGQARETLTMLNKAVAIQNENLALTRELYERLGEKVKGDRASIANLFISLLSFLGLKLDENNNVIKNVKSTTVSPSVKTHKRKTK